MPARYSHRIFSTPATVFLGDLPRGTTQVELYDYLKRTVGGDFDLVLKRYLHRLTLAFRPPGRHFYYAFIRFADLYLGKRID